MGESWIEYMKLDIKQLLECDTIYMLKGWESSKGAGLEFEIACELDYEIMYEDVDAMFLHQNQSLKSGEPCKHPGCLNHVTHRCEGCGRIAGR